MRIKSAAAACLSIFAVQLFALTVQLLDEPQAAPQPLMAMATQAPVTSPRLPTDLAPAQLPQIRPAAYKAPIDARQPSLGEQLKHIEPDLQYAR